MSVAPKPVREENDPNYRPLLDNRPSFHRDEKHKIEPHPQACESACSASAGRFQAPLRTPKALRLSERDEIPKMAQLEAHRRRRLRR